MAEVEARVSVQNGFAGQTCLLTTTYDMDFLPEVGDVVCVGESEPSGLVLEVYRRQWNGQGKSVIVFKRLVIDPDNQLYPTTSWQAWWTDRDGDLIEILMKNGWQDSNGREAGV